jgi:ubiquinone/menaquinone biosynthesis C-methylase UbiE
MGGEMTTGRLSAERAHGADIAARAAAVWGWDSPTGRLRLARRAAMLREAVSGRARVLEFGVGTGEFTRKIGSAARYFVGLDASHDLMLKGREDGAFAGVHLVEGDLHRLPFRPGVFDAICGSSVLHHLEVERALAEGNRVLKSGGVAAFSEPNFLNPQIAVVKRSLRLKKLVGDVPHETAFYSWQIRRIFLETGYREVAVKCYDFLYPLIPDALIGAAQKFGMMLESLPVIRSVAGSLWIRAVK